MRVSSGQLLSQAKEHFALEDYYGTIHLLEELCESGRAFADAHHLLGLSCHLVGQPERALEEFDRALELNPRYVEAHLHRGIVLTELGRPDEAEISFASAKQTDGPAQLGLPRDQSGKLANLHAQLGEAYVEAGKLDRAIEQYQVALELGPSFHDLKYRLARLLIDAGRTLEARQVLEEVVEARPGYAEGRATLGLACYLSGDADTARKIWTETVEKQPGESRAKAYLSMLDRVAQEQDA